MKKVLLIALLFLSITVPGYAQTLHRWPIDYYASPKAFSRWYDHDHNDYLYTDSNGNPTGPCSISGNVVCSRRIYDNTVGTAGGDKHHGTDIRWNGTTTYVRVSANGTLYYAILDCPSGSNPSCGSSYGNHVRIEHAGGKVSIYAHMLPGGPGQSGWNTCGQITGIMGNSGHSTATHLHYELWRNRTPGSAHTDRIDPFGGTGNWQNSSLWVNQNGAGTGNPSTQCQ